jgi:amidase
MLGVMAAVDTGDQATTRAERPAIADYTTVLKTDALKGARIGIARDFLGADEEVDWVVESALDAMRRAGATTVDVRYPRWILDGKGEFYNAVRWPEFPVQIAQYLATTGPKYPKSLDDLIARARQFTSTGDGGVVPNNTRWALFVREQSSGTIDDPKYLAVRDHVLPAVRMVVDGILAEHKLDAIVYPTASRRPALLAGPPDPPNTPSATNIANLTGFPDLIVPAGFTSGALPVGISFFGPAFSEPKLLALGYAFEQATKARRLPRLTPALAGESITVP